MYFLKVAPVNKMHIHTKLPLVPLLRTVRVPFPSVAEIRY